MRRKIFPDLRLVISILFSSILLITSGVGITYASDKLKIIEVPLKVKHQNLRFKKLLSEPVYQIVSQQNFIVFNSNRKIWIKYSGESLKVLSDLVQIPKECDWLQYMCAIGNKLVIAAGSYSEELREKDSETLRGGYIEGPRAVGLLVVQISPPQSRLIKEFNVTEKPLLVSENWPGIVIPDKIVLGMQSCAWDGKNLYIGDHGRLAQVLLDGEEVRLIQFDVGIALNRRTLFRDAGALWVAEDEGGADGGGIVKLGKGNKTQRFVPLNEPYVSTDSILRFRGRLLTSSLAGLVEIDEKRNVYIHYQLTKDKKTAAIYNLSIINNELWAVREDGWVRFDLANKSATHFLLKGDEASNNIQSIAYFDGNWFIGTDKELVMLQK